jgi:membrane-bound ClpP family serine protease
MIRKQSTRRFWSVLLISVGAALIFLATEAWAGTVLVVLGLSIEVIGIAIKQK